MFYMVSYISYYIVLIGYKSIFWDSTNMCEKKNIFLWVCGGKGCNFFKFSYLLYNWVIYGMINWEKKIKIHIDWQL